MTDDDDPTGARTAAAVDWAKDGRPGQVFCCFTQFSSDAVVKLVPRRLITRRPCPSCGRHDRAAVFASLESTGAATMGATG